MALTGRKVGVAMDFSEGSKVALKWAFEFLKKDDSLILIHVKPRGSLESRNLIWCDTGSPLIPFNELHDPEVMHGYGVELDPKVLELLETISKELEVTVLVKIYWGDAREKVSEAVADMKLDALIMGSRGLGAIKRVLLGSVTSYVLEHAACPVTVVKNTSHAA